MRLGERALGEFEIEQPVRVNGSRHFELIIGHALETDPRIIGLIAELFVD